MCIYIYVCVWVYSLWSRRMVYPQVCSSLHSPYEFTCTSIVWLKVYMLACFSYDLTLQSSSGALPDLAMKNPKDEQLSALAVQLKEAKLHAASTQEKKAGTPTRRFLISINYILVNLSGECSFEITNNGAGLEYGPSDMAQFIS